MTKKIYLTEGQFKNYVRMLTNSEKKEAIKENKTLSINDITNIINNSVKSVLNEMLVNNIDPHKVLLEELQNPNLFDDGEDDDDWYKSEDTDEISDDEVSALANGSINNANSIDKANAIASADARGADDNIDDINNHIDNALNGKVDHEIPVNSYTFITDLNLDDDYDNDLANILEENFGANVVEDENGTTVVTLQDYDSNNIEDFFKQNEISYKKN